MTRRSRFWKIQLGLSAAVLLSPLYAQTADAQTPDAQNANTPATGAKTRTCNDAVNGMSRTSGVRVVADSTVGLLQVSTSSEATTPQNLEAQLTELVKTLPKGTTWARLYLPANARRFAGDDVAAFAQAQSKLVGAFGGPATPGTLDVFGQKLPEDKAAAALQALNLVPVYLVTNPQERRPGFGLDADSSRWGTLSPEERKAWAERQAAQLSNMNPNDLGALFQQNFQIFGSLMSRLGPEQRQSLMQSMLGPGGPNIQFIPRPPQ